MPASGWLVVSILATLGLVSLSSAAAQHAGYGHPMLRVFSISHNLSRLAVPVTGDFLSFNGLRVLSMFWVILGHTVLMSLSPASFSVQSTLTYTSDWPFQMVAAAEYVEKDKAA